MAVDEHEQDYIPLATSPATADREDEQDQHDLGHEHEHEQGLISRRGRERKRKSRFIPSSLPLRPKTLLIISSVLLVLLILHSINIHIQYCFKHPSNSDANQEKEDEPGENPYFSTGDVWEHNDAVAAQLDRCASLGLLRNTSLPLAPHERLSAEEEAELMAQGCGTNQTTVVILASLWFAEAFAGTSTAGETIYAQSVISTLNALGYSYVFTSLGWYNADMRKTVELWRKHRWNVRMVLADPEQVDVCYRASEQECLKTESNLGGIEAWRLLSLWYWDDPGNPLGAEFTLSPSPRNPNYFLSYSIEPTCRRLPFLSSSQRAHPPQAYLLAKQMTYLADTPRFSWTLPTLKALEDDLGIHVVGGVQGDDRETAKAMEEIGLTNLGRLGKIEFYEQLGKSFVLIGVGQPRISPSPWDALCMGVPFINPILTWDEDDPSNRSLWHAQQWRMTDIEPPYVYHVHAHDLAGMRDAVDQALKTPIESWIPDYMTFDYVVHRMAETIDRDWRGVAGEIVERRKAAGEGEIVLL